MEEWLGFADGCRFSLDFPPGTKRASPFALCKDVFRDGLRVLSHFGCRHMVHSPAFPSFFQTFNGIPLTHLTYSPARLSISQPSSFFHHISPYSLLLLPRLIYYRIPQPCCSSPKTSQSRLTSPHHFNSTSNRQTPQRTDHAPNCSRHVFRRPFGTKKVKTL